MLQPFECYSAPTVRSPHKIVIVGEAPGEEEERAGIPFIGAAGRLFNHLARDAGFIYEFDYCKEGRHVNEYGRFNLRSQFHVTNVFSRRPPRNDLLTWCATKTEIKKQDKSYALPVMGSGKYLLPEYSEHLTRLRAELLQLKPALIIGLGAVALWALTGEGKIGNSRGVFLDLPEYATRSIFTFHPANILRQYENYALAWRDLTKARLWLNGELTPPLARQLCINPTWEEMEEYLQTFAAQPYRPLGVDIETAAGQITTVSYGWPENAICIPLWDPNTLPHLSNVYKTAEEEARAVRMIRRFAELPNPKVLQNGLYDMQYLLDLYDIRLHNVEDDTAILQHSIQPELPKALGVLASLYLNEPLWKFMRTSAKDEAKADE